MTATVYGGRWEIQGLLGEGGQAHTYRVKDLRDSSTGWVLKRLKNRLRLGRFEEEIAALQQVSSEHIPNIVDFSVDDSPYLVYREIEGKTLQDVVTQDNPLFDEVLDWVRDAVEAAQDAHSANVVHRDIKPENIIIDNQEPHRRAWLIDFGICQIDDSDVFRTDTGEALGSRSFSAPELDAGPPVDRTELVDVYSLGKVLYWSLTGGTHLRRETIGRRQMDLVPAPRRVERPYIERILLGSVTTNPTDRITSETMREEIEHFGVLMRQGVNMVGAQEQLCTVCRSGHLRRVQGDQAANIGIRPAGAHEGHRILKCDACGYVQFHHLEGTKYKHLWKI